MPAILIQGWVGLVWGDCLEKFKKSIHVRWGIRPKIEIERKSFNKYIFQVKRRTEILTKLTLD